MMNKNMQNIQNNTSVQNNIGPKNKMTNVQNIRLLLAKQTGIAMDKPFLAAFTKLLSLFAFSLSLSSSTNCLASSETSNTSGIELTEQNFAPNSASESPFIKNIEEEAAKARENWDSLCDAERLNVIKRFAEHYNEIDKKTYRKPIEIKVNSGD